MPLLLQQRGPEHTIFFLSTIVYVPDNEHPTTTELSMDCGIYRLIFCIQIGTNLPLHPTPSQATNLRSRIMIQLNRHRLRKHKKARLRQTKHN
jgi:hypothetical protein